MIPRAQYLLARLLDQLGLARLAARYRLLDLVPPALLFFQGLLLRLAVPGHPLGLVDQLEPADLEALESCRHCSICAVKNPHFSIY